MKKTMLIPDGNGNWQVGEVKEQTIKEDGKIAPPKRAFPGQTSTANFRKFPERWGKKQKPPQEKKAKPSIHILRNSLARPATAVYN